MKLLKGLVIIKSTKTKSIKKAKTLFQFPAFIHLKNNLEYISFFTEKYLTIKATSKKMIQLGERIQLSNFEELQPGELTILKKMIGNHANKFHDFKKLHITLKNIHKKEKARNGCSGRKWVGEQAQEAGLADP